MTKNYFALLSLFLFFLPASIAQSQSFDLKEMDVLIVRLESGQNKTKVIKQKLENATTAEMKKYWEQELKNLQVELKIKNQIIRTAFEEEFKFTKVLYIYDYSAKTLKAGKTKAIFLNQEFKVDPSIQFDSDSLQFLVAGEGRSASAAEGIYIHHSTMDRLKDRYLNFVKLNTIGLFFENIFSTDDATQEMYNAAIQKLNRRFYKSQRMVE